MWFYIMIVTLLILLVWLTRVREDFMDVSDYMNTIQNQKVLLKTLQLPESTDQPELVSKMQELMKKFDKISNTEFLNHAQQVAGMDPGELARTNLGISN
jgi:hypothetical protein